MALSGRLGALLGRRAGKRPSTFHTITLCLVLGAVGALVLDRLFVWLTPRTSSVETPNYAKLMESFSRAPTERERRVLDRSGYLAHRFAIGTAAPEFVLPGVAAGTDIDLASFRKRPVVLIFGSFSCDRFCEAIPHLRKLHQEQQQRADFLFINVTEAGHFIAGLEYVIQRESPGQVLSVAERRPRIQRAMEQMGLHMTAAIDQNEVGEANYQAYPLRLVVLDAGGRFALDQGIALERDWDFGAVERCLVNLQPAGAPSPEP